jgi:TPR repeat protein
MIKKVLLFVLLSIGHMGLSYADFQDGLNALDKEDYKTAFNEFLPLANQGDVDAQNKIGVLYNYGLGVIEDDEKAVQWYTKAANQGYGRAQNNLGMMYEDGEGVLKDGKQAVKWYTKAAEQGYASAQTNLADYLINQDAINWSEADMWYTKAAEQGYLRAQYNFAIMHQQSHPLQDIAVAVKWFTKAAEQGELDAQINLGVMYYEGRDWLDMDYQAVSQDYLEAFKWFSIPAEQDYPIAQYVLGEMYANGFGVLKDMAKAKYWIKKAYENTDEKVSNAAKDIWERFELSNY